MKGIKGLTREFFYDTILITQFKPLYNPTTTILRKAKYDDKPEANLIEKRL